uniref:Aryl hydrocarbon receptor interacting protein like 2 n=1 Tax=Neogobius melanostomus TaxID=47308 RepID=A0A8C6SY51_9GOBI
VKQFGGQWFEPQIQRSVVQLLPLSLVHTVVFLDTSLVFHFQTLLDNFERTVIDDSRRAGQPAEIFVGKMFKLGEVAEFWCDAVVSLYPIVSKGMRMIAQGKDPLEGQRHMCGMGNLFHYHSTGYPELDELMRTPQPLIFIMELLQVGDPMSYHRESWMMEKDEKLQTVPNLHMQGNALVKQREFRRAASKYKEAVLLLKTVQSKEMPSDIDYINLGRMIIPLELNYCQCMLELEEYYEVIEHTTELLEKHKGNFKAIYQRARAHAALFNEDEARKDFAIVEKLDPKFKPFVRLNLLNSFFFDDKARGQALRQQTAPHHDSPAPYFTLED